jgi:hypothetical protein
MASALAYTKTLKDQAERAEDVFAYKVVKHSLKLLRDYPLMLIKNTPINYTESDYLYVLWVKAVRIKTGESIFLLLLQARRSFTQTPKISDLLLILIEKR